MHLVMILMALGLAWSLRLAVSQTAGSWTQRWQRSLLFFLLPPLLLLMTALAVLWMGPQGKMLGLQASWLSYCLAMGFIGLAAVAIIKLAFQGWQSRQRICTYPQKLVAGKKARILEIALPYSAQIGFWRPELVVSRGLLNTLAQEHLQAVLAHEQAHCDYRDPFWFFWLGWLRSFTGWLPNTETLWQELLLLRELRADRKAAQQVDALLLAESLLAIAKAPLELPESCCTPFSCAFGSNRLTERIDALLASPESPPDSDWRTWSWILFGFAFLPWVTVPFHY